MKTKAVLKGGGVELHPLEIEHVTERYVAWLNDPDVTFGTELRFGEHSIEEVCNYVKETVNSSNNVMWRIIVDGEGHVGNIRLSAINAVHRHARVALLIGEKSVWGRGVGSAAIDCLAAHAFTDLALHKLTAGIYATNPGSRRAFEKCLFTLEATLKDDVVVDDGFVDVFLMTRFALALNGYG